MKVKVKHGNDNFLNQQTVDIPLLTFHKHNMIMSSDDEIKLHCYVKKIGVTFVELETGY